MAVAQLAHALTLPTSHPQAPRNLQLSLAASYEDMRAAQRLRHQVFVAEMGAALECAETGIESDRYDPYCQHLLVRDSNTGKVIGCYRILTDSQAVYAGGFYSETEFNISRVLALPGRFMEVGRTCVHPDYRNGATIGLLWAGLARFMVINKFRLPHGLRQCVDGAGAQTGGGDLSSSATESSQRAGVPRVAQDAGADAARCYRA